jgi:hypothetical protein
MRSDEILGLFALLFEIQDYPPLLRCPLCRLEDSPTIWIVESKIETGAALPADQMHSRTCDIKYMSFGAPKSATPDVISPPGIADGLFIESPIQLVVLRSTASRSGAYALPVAAHLGVPRLWNGSETVPSNSPAITKSAGALEALRNSGIMVPVIVRLPDARTAKKHFVACVRCTQGQVTPPG